MIYVKGQLYILHNAYICTYVNTKMFQLASLAESILTSVCSATTNCSDTSSDVFLLDCSVFTRTSSSNRDPCAVLRSLG